MHCYILILPKKLKLTEAQGHVQGICLKNPL